MSIVVSSFWYRTDWESHISGSRNSLRKRKLRGSICLPTVHQKSLELKLRFSSVLSELLMAKNEEIQQNLFSTSFYCLIEFHCCNFWIISMYNGNGKGKGKGCRWWTSHACPILFSHASSMVVRFYLSLIWGMWTIHSHVNVYKISLIALANNWKGDKAKEMPYFPSKKRKEKIDAIFDMNMPFGFHSSFCPFNNRKNIKINCYNCFGPFNK